MWASAGAVTAFDLSLSVRGGTGVGALLERIEAAARAVLDGGEQALVTRARQRQELETVARHLESVGRADLDTPVEFLAEDLRLAARAVGRLTGRIDIDEIYDLIFREFCIGK